MHSYHQYNQPDPPHQPFYLKTMLRHLQNTENVKRILDAGCGDGNFTASLFEAGYEMHGIDLSKGGIEKARQRYPGIKFAEASIYDDLCSACGINFFDAVISVEVIEHLYDPRLFVKRVFDSLRPGGVFIVTTPYWGYAKNVVLALTNRTDLALTALWDGGHIKHWSYKTLRQLLSEPGFEFLAFHGAGRKIPFLWSGMLMVVRKPVRN